jgi:hypothetical protein
MKTPKNEAKTRTSRGATPTDPETPPQSAPGLATD